MASPISYILNQYKNKVNWFIKFYESGTTTVKEAFHDSQGLSGSNKHQINSEGFIENPDTNESTILYLGGYFDCYMFETEAEADANDFTNASKIADNVTADKDSAALNIPNADETNYGLVELATQGEAEATSPVDENLATTPFKLDIIAVDNMASYVASPAEVLAKAPNKSMTAADYPNLAGLYNPAAPVKEFIIGQTRWIHPDNITVDELLQDGAVYDPNVRPLGTLVDYKQGDGETIGVTQGTKNEFLAVNANVEGAPLKFLQVAPQRWFGIIQYNGLNYYCESDNLTFWNIYTTEINAVNLEIENCTLAFNPDEDNFSLLYPEGSNMRFASAYLGTTGIDIKTSGILFTSDDPEVYLFEYDTNIQQFIIITRVDIILTLDFIALDTTFGGFTDEISSSIITSVDQKRLQILDDRYYFAYRSKIVSNEITLTSLEILNGNPDLAEIKQQIIPTLTPTTSFNNININSDGVLAVVIGYESATGKFEILTSSTPDDENSYSTIIVDTGFTSMTADAYCIPVKNYWLLKTGDNINSAYTKDFVTIDLETNYTGEGSHLNMFASYIEGTDKFVEYTSAGSVDGHMYRLENEATIDWAYKTIKMMGAPDEGGKSITGWNNPVSTEMFDTNSGASPTGFVKITDTLYYGLVREYLVDAGNYNITKTTDAGDSWTILPTSSTGSTNANPSQENMTWDGGDYILFSNNNDVSIFQISTETFTTLNYNMFSGSPSISGSQSIAHWNENLGTFVLFNHRDDLGNLYITQFVNNPASRTATTISTTDQNFDYNSWGSSSNKEFGYYNGKYYVFDLNNYRLYSFDEGTWVMTLVHTFTPSLSTSYGTSQSLSTRVNFNDKGEMAIILSWDNSTKQIETGHSTDLISFNQSILNHNSVQTAILNQMVIVPLFDSWIFRGFSKDTLITKDFLTLSYEKNDWIVNDGSGNFMFYDWDNINNKVKQYTSGSSVLSGNPIFRNDVDAIVDITAADPDYVDRSTPYLVPVVYAPII